MSIYEQMLGKLTEQYQRLNENGLPDWAVHKITPGITDEIVVPTIPFVGKHYFEQTKKVLVYASAEVLNNHLCAEETDRPWLDEDCYARNRHRNCFDWWKAGGGSGFFPSVHITPMNNGALSTAVYYLVSQIYGVEYSSPEEFYETIAFGNYGKFSIETPYQTKLRENPGMSSEEKKELKKEQNKNTDYTCLNKTEAREKLEASMLYLKSDIEILKPDLVILPEKIYKIHQKSFREKCGELKSVQIYQINAGVVNRTIAKMKDPKTNQLKYPPMKKEKLSESVRRWMEKMLLEGKTGISKEGYLSLFTYLEQQLQAYLSEKHL